VLTGLPGAHLVVPVSALTQLSSDQENLVRYKHAFTATALIAGLVLAGCGGDGDTAGTGQTPSATTEQSFNDADIEFTQGVIPHHRQAIEMAQLAAERAASPDVQQLAADIEAAQDPEIETMTGWLESWGEDVPDDMSGMDGMPMDDMAGMMSAQEMAQLEAASGTAFDRMFLTTMIEHHEGAIEMARTEQTDGEYAVELAEMIESNQTAQIDTMRVMLGS
jgi:uncharacterized protein (DUF305 family)